jgi:hypothetical protein
VFWIIFSSEEPYLGAVTKYTRCIMKSEDCTWPVQATIKLEAFKISLERKYVIFFEISWIVSNYNGQAVRQMGGPPTTFIMFIC